MKSVDRIFWTSLFLAIALSVLGVGLGFILARDARGDEITITIGTDTWRGEVKRVAAELPAPLPIPARRMGFLFWQISDPVDRAWAPYAQALAGIDVTVQNGWAERMSDQYRYQWLPRYAEWAAAQGWRYQPYFPIAKSDPTRVAVLDWPANVERAMTASEGEWTDEQLVALRAAIPARILTAFPEGVYATGTNGRKPGQDFAQRWARVAPWPPAGPGATEAQFRSPFELVGAARVADAAGIPFVVLGPQMYNSYLSRPEDPRLLRLSVALAAQATLRGCDICMWGEGHVTQDDALIALNAVAATMREVNALPILAEARRQPAALGVYVGADHAAGYKGSLVMWEALCRSNLPFECFTNIHDAERYKAVLVPAVRVNAWDAGELAWFAARGRTAPATVPASFTPAEEAFLASLGIPVLTQCGDGGRYGHVSAWPPRWIPRWTTPLVSASATQWKATFDQIGVGANYLSDITRIIDGLRLACAGVGIEPALTDTNIVRRLFVQAGATCAWDVDLSTGTSSITPLEAQP